MRHFVVLLVCLGASAAYAGTTINGTTITFDDNSMQSKAAPSDHGGSGNTVGGTDSVVGGGDTNLVTDDYGTIGGGQYNTAGDENGLTWDSPGATVSGGLSNFASAYGSTVGGGGFNTADGEYSFVAGYFTDDLGHNNSFVWGGYTGLRTSAGADTFNVWSAGGIYLNGSVEHASDRNMKEGFTFVSAREVLDKVVEMPVTAWRFKGEDESVRHIGPMAQDFMAAFGYGKSDKHITATDADGVALAAIQGLNEKLESQRTEDAEVITALRWHNAQLAARLARLEKAVLPESESTPTGTD